MSGAQSVRIGAGIMMLAALLFLMYAVLFFFRASEPTAFDTIQIRESGAARSGDCELGKVPQMALRLRYRESRDCLLAR
jgi:hypothetical protein